jgi:flagellar export protein FliJ
VKKFSFRLDSVLRLRELQLAAEKERYQRVLSELTRLEQTLAAMAGERAEALNFVRNQPAAGNVELRSLSAFLLGADARATNLRKSIERNRILLEEHRQRVIAAERSERLLIKLKEARLAEWRLESNRELEALAQEAWNAAQRFRNRPDGS